MNRLYDLRKSFLYAWHGILFCVRHEKNMRIHITVMMYVMFFAQFYDFTRGEFLLLIITCVIVLSLEMLNTSIEVVVDKVSPMYSALAKVAKDVAAGAVFVSAIAAVIIGIGLFGDIERIKTIIGFLTTDIFNGSMFIAFSSLAILFINSGKKRKTRGKNNNDSKQ